MGLERRKTPRIAIEFEIVASNPFLNADARITNVSKTGAFIETGEPLAEDTALAIDIELPGDSERMTINAKVVWTKAVCNASAAGMGIQFTDILPEDQNKLADFIEQNTLPSDS